MNYRAKIRMYRHGLGDCFLIALPRTDGVNRPFYIMIDCGVILGTSDPGSIMAEVVENIIAATGGEIDLLVATHEHWDHLSGFIQAQAAFDKLTVHEVWLGWTEDNRDSLTRKLKRERDRALTSLRLGLNRMQLAGEDQTEEAAELGGILEFFGAAKGASTGDALAYVKKKCDNLRYCLPTDAPVQRGGATFYVLGPPHDEKLLRKINPSKREKETYGLALDGLQLFMDGAATALEINDKGRPFDRQFEIPFPYAAEMPFFKQHYWMSEDASMWRRIDVDWLDGSTELALQLDSLTNNTSLVIAIELRDGDVLLFAADAQVGNWLSWQDLEWNVDGKKVPGPDLLKRAILYKVGHHGSHNATLKQDGLEQMKNLRVAMIPVDEKMAKKKRWNHMPLDELVDELEQRAKGAVLRADKRMPPTQEQVIEDPLFFEVTF
jgi:beta-lactamase superfamily II metal-dependent hydrolase